MAFSYLENTVVKTDISAQYAANLVGTSCGTFIVFCDNILF